MRVIDSHGEGTNVQYSEMKRYRSYNQKMSIGILRKGWRANRHGTEILAFQSQDPPPIRVLQ